MSASELGFNKFQGIVPVQLAMMPNAAVMYGSRVCACPVVLLWCYSAVLTDASGGLHVVMRCVTQRRARE